MPRKNQWLPGQNNEPGYKTDFRSYNIGQVKTPLGYIIVAATLIVCVVILDTFILGMPNLNGPAITIVVIADLVLLGLALFNAVRGTRRWIWRKKNVNLTGGVYLRPWERSGGAQYR